MVEFDKVLIIGVGLIGGSLALALKKAGAAREIVGCSRSLQTLEKAVKLGVIDRYCRHPAEELAGSDVVVVAAPVLSFDPIFEAISQGNYQNSVITDVGSVKSSVVESARRHLDADYRNFVGAHPIAGREQSGVDAATPELFEGQRTIVTPTEYSAPEAVARVVRMWESAGSVVSEMDVVLHDEILSASSHLPHLIAFGLVHYMEHHANRNECFDLAASGFYDFTRIASSDPVMWRDISMANAAAIKRELKGYIGELESISNRIVEGDAAGLEEILRAAKEARDRNLARRLK